MKVNHIFIILTALVITSCSPKLRLTGKLIISQNDDPKEKIYYTFDDNPLTKEKFINLNQKNTYNWIYDIDELKKKEIKELIFTYNLETDIKDEYECTHRIRIDKILKKFDDKKNIEINTDLNIFLNCETSIIYGANDDNLSRFVGHYILKSDNNKEYLVKLKDSFYEYELFIKDSLLNREIGRWRYNEKENRLILYTHYRENEEIGLLKKVDNQYIFKITNKNNQLKFNSKKYKLKKIR